MDYDDNDSQDQDHHLAGEGSSRVSPALRPYVLPKFEFDDSLPGHLRFDSLVENEVFLGISSQEDNQWIEEYSRGTSAIQFSSSVAESRHKNVWSEATSSESVEMLLKSVGQEDRVVEEKIIEKLNGCDDPGSLTNIMDPNLKQCDGKDRFISAHNAIASDKLQKNFVGSKLSSDCEQSHARFTSQAQEIKISDGELDSVVIDDKYRLSVTEKKVDENFDDINQEVSNLANESFNNELQEDPSVSKVECENAGSSQNVDAGIEELKSLENPQEVPERCIENSSGVSKNFSSSEVEHVIEGKDNNLDSLTKSGIIIETCTYSEEKPSVEVSILVNEEPIDSLPIGGCDMQTVEGCNAHDCSAENSQGSKSAATASVICSEINQELNDSLHEESLAGSLNCGSVKMQVIEEANTKSEVPGSPKSNAGSLCELSNMQSHSDEQTENVVHSDGRQVTSDESMVYVGNNLSEMGEGSDNVGTSLTAACSSAELPAEDNRFKVHAGDSMDEDPNLPPKVSGLAQVGDETRSTDSGAISMDQDVTFNERGDARLPLDSGDMDMEVVGAPDSHKNVEPSSTAEGCKGFIATAHGFESNTAVLTDAVAAVESSEKSSPDTLDGAPSGSVATANVVTEDQPKSPILGVSLLHDDNEEKAVGISSEGRSKKGSPEVLSMVDPMLEAPLSGVEKDAVFDCARKVVHEMAGHCDPPVENFNSSLRVQAAEDNAGGLEFSKTVETTPLSYDSSAEGGSNAEARDLPDPKGLITGQDRTEPLNLAVKLSDEQQASVDVAGPSECDSASSDKPKTLGLSDTNSFEPSQSAKAKHEAAKGSLYEDAPLLKVINEVKPKVQSVSSNSATKEEKSSTFEVSASAGPGPTGIQELNLAKNMKVPSVNSSGSLLDPNKLHEVSLVSPQTPSSLVTQAGSKGKSERKATRKSAGKESAKKSNQTKGKTSVRRPEELKPNESVEPNFRKPSGSLPIPTSNLPDLNNTASKFQQSFTDIQQVQLRAQILVYGSLIAGMLLEEPRMIAAFGQSDGGRRAWEATWHSYQQRVHAHKPPANNPDTPTQSRSVLNNKGNKDPSNMSTSSPIVSPMIPISSPLWNISTPFDGLPSSVIPISPLLDYRQVLSPLHPFQTPRGQNFAGHPFPGQWVSSSPISAFGDCLDALPITEAVKLTTVKESAILGDHSASPSVLPASSPLSNMKNATSQPSSDTKSRKRKKDAASVAGSTSTPIVPLPRVSHSEGYNQISFLAQNQTPVVTSISNHGGFLSSVSPSDQNIKKGVTTEEKLSKVEESKLRAEDAAMHAAAAISHCEGVWSQLKRHKDSGFVAENEAKLASAAASIAAAASVAKVAAAAAKIASNVAEQARLMAEEISLSSRTEFDKTKTDYMSTSADRNKSNDHPNSIISVAREAARRRIEAASAAAKHAKNLDAIVKAAELAAEAVSQAGKIVAMGNPLPLRDLVEAGPEGYWKAAQLSNQSGYSGQKNLEDAANAKETRTAKLVFSPEKDSGILAENQITVIDATHKNDRKAKAHRSPDLSKIVSMVPEPESGSFHMSVEQNMPQGTPGTSKENLIQEGCLVEVYKDDNKHKNAWYAANVLSLKDGKAFVCYTEIQSDEGSGQLKEWVLLDVEGMETPKIRIAHPVTTMRFEGSKKRRRTAVTDYAWSSGDRVDVWVQDCWREGVVLETNKTDATSLTVRFPAQEETSVVRSWHVRPTLVWKDGNWIDWFSLKGSRSSESDYPREKRPKLDTFKPLKDVESGRIEDSRTLPVSARESSFDVGRSSRDENKLKTRKLTKSGLQKEGSGVVFGVPKPGKKQKFMDVSYVADGSNKSNAPNDSVKIASFLMPRGSRKVSKNDAKGKQVLDTKSKVLKPRKPPVPTFGTLAQKDRSKSSKPALMTNKPVEGSENLRGHDNRMEFGSSPNTDDAMEGAGFPPDVPKEVLTSKSVSKRVNKGIVASGGGKSTKAEVKDQSSSEIGEPRRSNRRIQPTSRLLEGLQSSLTISKTPAVSHTSQRSNNKVPPKAGNGNQG